MKVFIINFNRLTYLKNIVEWCLRNNLEPVVVDNHSDYSPLLAYYHSKPCQVIYLPENYGHTVIWYGLIQLPKERFIVTDPDLDMSGVPADFLDVMNSGLDKYPDFNKCGLSLEINDLPDTEEGNLIRNECEKEMWEHPLDDKYFLAPVDTTFALYREGSYTYFLEGIRTNRPYTARHYSWYYTDFALLPEDEKHYYLSANDSASGKKRLLK